MRSKGSWKLWRDFRRQAHRSHLDWCSSLTYHVGCPLGGIIRSERATAIAVLGAGSLYRPLTFWASNESVLSDFRKPILLGVLTFALGFGLYVSLLRVWRRQIPVSILAASLLILLLEWRRFSTGAHVVLLASVLVAPLLVTHLSGRFRKGVAASFILFFGLSPLLQVVMAHVQNPGDVPLVDLTPHPTVSSTGLAEDVLVVVVDGYPAPLVAEERFGHEVDTLRGRLSSIGYTVPSMAWSPYMTTRFSIPALMEVRPVVDIESDASWLSTHNLFRIVGGESLVAAALRSAGFAYTHIESGWTGGRCISVDICVPGPMIDEVTFHLLSPSILGHWMRSEFGSWFVASAIHTHQQLLQLEPLFGDGKHDFVFAHLTLPHPPVVVDGNCRVLDTRSQLRLVDGTDASSSDFAQQLACADRLISDIAELAASSTAVVITSDHGSKTRGQMQVSPDEWGEDDIAEALGIFLGYRLPDGCSEPEQAVSTAVMRALMRCAVGLTHASVDEASVVGIMEFRTVDVSERQSIEAGLIGNDVVDEEVLGATLP